MVEKPYLILDEIPSLLKGMRMGYIAAKIVGDEGRTITLAHCPCACISSIDGMHINAFIYALN